MDKFNPHLLILAREARGLTQADLAKRAEIGQGTLSKLEAGLKAPAENTVSLLADTLGFPTSFMFQEGQPYGFPPYHYRKRKKLSAKALGRIVAEMNIRRMHVKRLSNSFELAPKAALPEIDRDEYHGRASRRLDIEDVARSVREAWMLPTGPVHNMIELLESKGGIVIPCDFGTDLIDAMSQRIDGMPTLFFVNMHSPADRVRMTLAHELAHMVLHTVSLADDETMEEEADQFAGAFLLPADEIRSQLRQFDLRHLANLKRYWKVSMQAIAMRASKLNLISDYQAKMFWIEMSKLGYRKREPNEPPREEPRLLKSMIAYHQRKLSYSVEEIAKLLHLTPDEFVRMYGSDAYPTHPKVQLRVVK